MKSQETLNQGKIRLSGTKSILLESISKLEFNFGSSLDKAHLRLAAAKAVLRLSKHWDHRIPIDVFYLTLGISEVKLNLLSLLNYRFH